MARWQWPKHLPLLFAQVEFVPAVHGFRVSHSQTAPGGDTSECYLTQAQATAAGGTECSGNAQLSAQLQYLNSQLNKPLRYLMCANEPWRSDAHNELKGQLGAVQPPKTQFQGQLGGTAGATRTLIQG